MDPYLVLLAALLLYVLVFGGLSLLRREPLSARFAIEALVVGGVILAFGRAFQAPPSPILFCGAVYLLTMRVRLLVDLGSALAQGGRLRAAFRVYEVARRVAVDRTDRLIVSANQGAALLVGGRVPEAITVLQEVLQHTGSLGIKLEATSRYNLGMAYLKQGQVGRARAQLTEAAELLPGSVCARQARRALKRLDARPEEEAQS